MGIEMYILIGIFTFLVVIASVSLLKYIKKVKELERIEEIEEKKFLNLVDEIIKKRKENK